MDGKGFHGCAQVLAVALYPSNGEISPSVIDPWIGGFQVIRGKFLKSSNNDIGYSRRR